MAFQKVKLNYVAAVAPVIPKETISIPSSYLENLDRAISKKIKQNEAERAVGMEIAGRYTVR